MAALRAGQMMVGTPYQVVRELGAGGMGVVYEVQHVRLKKHYVAKVILEQVRGEEGVQKRMEREADVLGKINHPNIVQVHDVGTMPDGTSYFIMEKLEGMDLRHAMQQGAIGPSHALRIVIDVLDALEHVHQRGIVHRDIKPENVFLAQQATGIATKVLDFGIVHIVDGDGKASRDRITKTGGFVGTLYYAAPEQMQGSRPAPASDVYAAGLVLYELLAGRGPFDDDAGVGLTRCFKPAPALPSELGADLVDTVAAALEQTPEKRPTAGEIARRLRHALAAMPADTSNEIEHLLLQVGAQPRAGAGGIAPTEAPKTPLMHGAPLTPTNALAPTTMAAAAAADAVSVAPASPRAAEAVSVAPMSPRVPPSGPTLSSPSPAARADTSPGTYSTVNGTTPRPPRASALGAVVAIGGFLVLVGLVVFGGLRLLRPGPGTALPSVAASVEEPSPETPTASANAPTAKEPTLEAPSPEAPIPETPTAKEPIAKEPTPEAPTREPAAATPTAVAAPAVAAPAPAPVKPAAPKPGKAKKEGYVDHL
ncbi:MAG: protein kinase [Labilithrix sp.]|nr:protein kinase [Labilithrix sp.]MCW5812240.1 protein kinase [Labilithrix sp.]